MHIHSGGMVPHGKLGIFYAQRVLSDSMVASYQARRLQVDKCILYAILPRVNAHSNKNYGLP